jgi:hypothetical protein
MYLNYSDCYVILDLLKYIVSCKTVTHYSNYKPDYLNLDGFCFTKLSLSVLYWVDLSIYWFASAT